MFGGPSFQLFRALGFPISAHWSLVLAVILMGISHGSVAGIWLSFGLFTSVLLHELGHAVVARARRVPIEGIELHLFGGVAKMTAPPRSPRDEIAIAVAGPLVSLALGALAFVATRFVPDAPSWLNWLGGVNVMLGLFNLLPALPMDGGRVLRAALASRLGLVDGTLKAVSVGRYIALGLAVLGVFTNPWLIAVALLVWLMGRSERAQVQRHEVLSRLGFSDEAFDPWARYARAADRDRKPRSGALEPEVIPADGPLGFDEQHPAAVLARMLGQPIPASARRGRAEVRHRVVRDALGRHVVVAESFYRF